MLFYQSVFLNSKMYLCNKQILIKMQSIVITPKSRKSGVFLKKLLSKLSDVKSIEIVEEKEEVPFVVLSESSLEKEWASEEDDIWDEWAKQKLKNVR
jgi:acetolactate synthase regulatory subunit